jgi:hypothetical protein
VLDRRLLTRCYGEYFFRSVPVRHRVYADADTLLDDVQDFLNS